MSPVQQIALIDKRIDGIRLELYRRGSRPGLNVSEWTLVWERNPDLWARNEELFRQRGAAQLVRDAEINRAYRAEQRRIRASYRRAS